MGIHKFTLLAITLGGLILYLNLVPDPFLGMNIIPASSVIPWGLNIKHPSVSPDRVCSGIYPVDTSVFRGVPISQNIFTAKAASNFIVSRIARYVGPPLSKKLS